MLYGFTPVGFDVKSLSLHSLGVHLDRSALTRLHVSPTKLFCLKHFDLSQMMFMLLAKTGD